MDSKVCFSNLKVYGSVHYSTYSRTDLPKLLAKGNKEVIPIVTVLNKTTVI